MKETIFICEFCESKEKTMPDGEYPYKKGWKFLYQLNYKYINQKTEKYTEKHFCSKKCMLDWVNLQLNEMKGG